MSRPFELQGHRGARALKPENTLPSFEAAFDLGVTSVETDVHLTGDGVPVLYHDPAVTARLCRLAPGGTAPDPTGRPPVSSLTLAELRQYRANLNPDPGRFPRQDAAVTRATRLFAEGRGIEPYAPPALADLFAFAAAYAGALGEAAGKTAAQRARAAAVRFDIELKTVPFRAGAEGLHRLEGQTLAAIRAAGMVRRTAVRSFDHRSVRRLLAAEPGLTAAVLVAGTAPVAPDLLARAAGATVYAAEIDFLDAEQVRQLHHAGVRVLPWTANALADWERLLDWGVDGITTDEPDRLADLLRTRGLVF